MVKRKLREPLEDRKGSLFFDGFSVKELAEKYDISTGTIRAIWNDEVWIHITKNLTKNALISTLLKEEVEPLKDTFLSNINNCKSLSIKKLPTS